MRSNRFTRRARPHPSILFRAARGLTLGVIALNAASARAAPARENAIRVSFTEDPAMVRVGTDDVALDHLTEAISAHLPADVVLLQEGAGSRLPANTLLPVLDRVLRAGVPARAAGTKKRGAPKMQRSELVLEQWTEGAPSVADVCVEGALPKSFAVRGLDPLLGVDLRGVCAFDRDGRQCTLREFPSGLLDGACPGEPGMSATIAIQFGPGATLLDLVFLLDNLHDRGFGRALFLLRTDANDTAGLLLSLDPDGDRPSSLPHRAQGLGKVDKPAYRAMRLLCEEAIFAMRLGLDADGSLPGDEDFTTAESTALALMAFLGAGVRGGDGTSAGHAVLAMQRWLMAWPPDPNKRYKRRERTIVAASMLEAYGRTRHPLLKLRATEGFQEIAKELATDQELRDGIEKGFEAIGLHWARVTGIPGARESGNRLLAIVEGALNSETGEITQTWSGRNSADYAALALALVQIGGSGTGTDRIKWMSKQTGEDMPSPDSNVSNTNRAFGAFFGARLACEDNGEMLSRFVNMLTESLPRSPPKDDRDYESDAKDSIHCPWSGGGALHSAGRVALMTMTYQLPTLAILSKQFHKPRKG